MQRLILWNVEIRKEGKNFLFVFPLEMISFFSWEASQILRRLQDKTEPALQAVLKHF